MPTQQNDKNMTSSGITQFFPIFQFFRNRWKIISTGILVGCLAGAVAIAMIPPRFDATAIITMARVPSHGRSGNVSLASPDNAEETTVANVEEPALLLERLKLPSTYTPAMLEACRSRQEEELRSEDVANLISAGIPRNTGAVVTFRIRLKSPEAAASCANALFDMIRSQQQVLVDVEVKHLKEAAGMLENRIAAGKEALTNVDHRGNLQIFLLAERDQLYLLNQQLYTIQRDLQRVTPTTLASPVYSSRIPVSPQRSLIMTAAALAGFFLGLLVAAFRELSQKGSDLEENQA